MNRDTDIQTVMTLCPHSIGLDQNGKLAREMMRKYGVRHLPVQSGGQLCGVVSDRDIKFAAAYTKVEEEELKIEEVYTPEPYVVAPDEKLVNVVRHMEREKLGCALVSAGGKLVGIFTTVDACRVLAENLEA